MSTYEELQLIVSVAMLIVAILNFTHKKIAVLCTLASLGQLFFNLIFRRVG